MPEELMNGTDVETIFSDISTMIYDAKNEVMMRVNTSVITLYWNIGKKLSEEVLQGKKADYGKNIIGDLSERLTSEYGKGFEKSSVFKMVKFYQAFAEWYYNGHTNEADPNTCILCIHLTDGVLMSHGTRYDIDFQ